MSVQACTVQELRGARGARWTGASLVGANTCANNLSHFLRAKRTVWRVSDPEAFAIDELVLRCQQGDRAAFGELFHRYRADVARVVTRMLGPGPDVEDIAQEVFLQVFRTIGGFQGKAKFSTWLYRISVTTVLMHRRAQRSRPTLVDEHYDRVASSMAGPDCGAIQRRRVAAFYRVLDALAEKKRTVFILHDIEGFSSPEIAEILEISALTVRTRLFYARREILARMRQQPALVTLVPLMQRGNGADSRAKTAGKPADEMRTGRSTQSNEELVSDAANADHVPKEPYETSDIDALGQAMELAVSAKESP